MMRILAGLLSTSLLALGLWTGVGEAAAKIRVVTTTTDLKALTEAVGGDLVDVDALARGSQNAHDLEVRPSLMVKVRRADLLVMNGLDLDQWAEIVVRGANNPNVLFGSPGRVDASGGIMVLEVPHSRIDRSMGDVHPLGNPHYTVDPGMAPIVTGNILEGLARVAPKHRATFERNREEFLGRLAQAMTRWSAELAAFKGAKVVVDHNMWPYFLTRFGLVQVGTIEERPGIPATPGHLAKLIALMKEQKIRVVLAVPWGDYKLTEWVAQESGAKAVVVASAVGAVKGTDSYLDTIDYNVRAIAQALK
jgi:zinc/manganese transport system substrate-binding protein